METVKNEKNTKIAKVTKIIIIIILCLLVVKFIVNFTRPSGEELVNQFETAVNQGDIDTLKSLVKGTNEMKITKQNLEQLVVYAKDEPNYLKESIFIMKAQVAMEEKDKESKSQNPIFKTETEGEIKQSGDYYVTKEDGWFTSYQIHARPYSLTVSSDQADTLIKVNNDKVLTTKEDNLETTVQNLPPGTYSITASKKYEFAEIESEKEINLFEDKKFNKSISLEVTGKQLPIQSSVKDISVFVNGKDINKKAFVVVEDLLGRETSNAELFGPFSTDGSVEVHGEATFPWGVVKSEPEVIREDTKSINVTPKPFAGVSVKEAVVQTINDYAKQHIESYVKQDAGVIKTATDSIIKEHSEKIQFDKTNEHYWKGTALGTRINFEKAAIINEQNGYQVKIPVEFHYNQREYIKGFSDNKPLMDVFEEATITLIFNEKSKKWLVFDIQNKYFSNEDFNNEEVVKTDF